MCWRDKWVADFDGINDDDNRKHFDSILRIPGPWDTILMEGPRRKFQSQREAISSNFNDCGRVPHRRKKCNDREVLYNDSITLAQILLCPDSDAITLRPHLRCALLMVVFLIIPSDTQQYALNLGYIS